MSLLSQTLGAFTLNYPSKTEQNNDVYHVIVASYQNEVYAFNKVNILKNLGFVDAKIIKNENRVVVKEINIKRKHVKPRKEGDVGKISQFEAPIHSSNVMLYNQDKQLASRVGYKVDESGNKVRVFKKLLSTN